MRKKGEVKERAQLSDRPNLRIIHLPKVNDFVGFALGNSEQGQLANILYRDAISSDDISFYTYADAIAREFLIPAKVAIDGVHHTLIVIHKDLSADVYVNNIPLSIEMRPKRDLAKGADVMKSDIADIRKLTFPGIEITNDDKVIFCFKVGWRFGLYFEVGKRPWSKLEVAGFTDELLDLEQMQRDIGKLYRKLLFYDLYKSLETASVFRKLIRDGWFPFIEIMGSDYDAIRIAYQEDFNIQLKVDELVEVFNDERIDRIASKWWKQPAYADKRIIIEAALMAFKQRDQAGYINCIKNLWTEIEGLLRHIYRAEIGNGDNLKSDRLVQYIIDKAKSAAGEGSLLLPEYFLAYLKDVAFANFDGNDENPGMSRNTSSHGVAASDKYTKERALQLILVLDQIYFYSSTSDE